MADQIVDACCLINLYASGQLEAILPACGGEFSLSEQVRAETLSVRQPDPNDPSLFIPVPVDLSSALSRGLLKECRFESEVELSHFVEFAAKIDDGEASCLAIAKSRGWFVATDDRKAIRLASESDVSVITTPELVQRWAQAAAPSEIEAAQTIRSIERFAKFRPRQSSSLYEWWTKLAELVP